MDEEKCFEVVLNAKLYHSNKHRKRKNMYGTIKKQFCLKSETFLNNDGT